MAISDLRLRDTSQCMANSRVLPSVIGGAGGAWLPFVNARAYASLLASLAMTSVVIANFSLASAKRIY
jgi:hypothetical protein